jgi:hypothetical protein
MTTGTIILGVVLVVIVVAAIAAVLMQRSKKRSEALQSQFGPEYDRTVEARGDQRAAERDLRERQSRRSSLEVRDLDPARRQEFSQSWERTQGHFVDDPAAAVTEAYLLVRTVMSERGYPTDDFERQADDVSVDHSEVVGDYREAVRISEASGRGEASTEDLREAMVHYRALFTGLLEVHQSEVQRSSQESHESQESQESQER